MNRDESSQMDIPLIRPMQQVDPAVIAKLPNMTKALQLCQTMSGLDDAQFYGAGGIVKDQAQWSRIMGPSAHNFPHDKFNLMMDKAGNEVPLLYLLHSRHYDLSSLRHTETETERKLRLAYEEISALRRVVQVTR